MKEEKKNKFLRGFGYAFSGICNTYKTELNFRVHFFAMIVVVVLGSFLSLSVSEWLWILLSIALVLAAELFNTALESLANLVSLEFQPLIKKSKDASAAAVLVVSIFALLVGVFIFIPKLWDLF